ncbi:hypothetical protein L202_04420 [Cryptococcus amylolentus CBS 6039]|uniref:Meiotically up-regulated protein Msb1/Mug8 domain-containing protein n=2 Tax=Cryptococcus amylolentus TaxID=104669 RepID=A0A1E3HRW5_9TREE|nr:hypothetical protein L202_04420 [Cryptococcus amylolentus CBS 6039]ODN78885.1 hypothetical protein L202_04420 [Cryptococcus amylolentus CBS 6039]
MRPRIPARLSGELVQLGVLLPWAARASSSTAVGREEGGQRRGREEGAVNRRLPLYPDERHIQQKAQGSNNTSDPDEFFAGGASSTTNARAKAASSSDAEPPKSSFGALRESRDSTEDSRSLPCIPKPPPTVVHLLLSKPHPPAPSQIFAHLPSSPQDLNKASGELLISYSAHMGDYKTQKSTIDLLVKRRLVPLGYKKRIKIRGRDKVQTSKQGIWEMRANEWALRRWPPIESLEDEGRYTTSQLLGRLHHLLLYGEAPTFEFALKLLCNASDHINDSPSVKGKERERQGGEVDVLNLYLAYAPRLAPADSLLSTFASAFPSNRLNRQSLHLSILSLLSPPSPAAQAHQVTPKQVLAMLETFLSKGILPGLETWRHIGKFATKFGIKDLGKVGWEGWFGSLGYAEARALLGPLSYFPNSIFDGELGADEQGAEDQDSWQLRFQHLGVQKTRWARIVGRMEKKGWVQKSEAGEGRWGYVWKDAKGPVVGEVVGKQEPTETQGLTEPRQEKEEKDESEGKEESKAAKGDVRKPHQRDLRTLLFRPRNPYYPRVPQVAQRHIQSLRPGAPSPPPSS